jgi:hypothetical protein
VMVVLLCVYVGIALCWDVGLVDESRWWCGPVKAIARLGWLPLIIVAACSGKLRWRR